MREIPSLYSLNRGVVSRYGLARADVKRLAMAAEMQTNWMPRVLGPMSLRAGLGYVGGIYANAVERILKFVFSTNDTALVELTPNLMRVWISDVLLTRPAVTTTITNGTFPTDLTGWTDTDDAGATSSWAAPNYMQLVGDGTARAIREQHVTNSSHGVEHGIRITIARGPVVCRIGTTSGAEDLLNETTLYTGTHSISIAPAGDFYIRFFSTLTRKVWVSGCTIEAAGVVTIPTTWSANDLQNVRFDQSGDVLFCACNGQQQRRIERRGTRPGARSWSFALYNANDGPFYLQNVTPTTIAPSAIDGNVTLTASVPLFRSTQVGSLFSVTSIGQVVSTTASASGIGTKSIRVTGTGTARAWTMTISGDATGSTVSLQRSFDNTTWVSTGPPNVWTADGTYGSNDGADNQIIYYRMYLTTRVAPDSVTMTMRYAGGSVRGLCRITGYTNATTVDAEVLSQFGGTDPSDTWQEGKWSDKNGWPTAVKLHEGRMWWSGIDGNYGSISDAFDSFDETFPGNAGPINRTIGSGAVDTVNWLLSLKGLVLGAQGAEFSVRASSLDEPLTPTNYNVKCSSTQGSANVDAVKVDQVGYFLARNKTRVFSVGFSLQDYDFAATNMMELAPEIGSPGIVRMDVQRHPDTRLHCVRSDGTVVVLVVNKTEDVLAWVPITTSGYVEDVVVLPALDGNLDDQVYYVVKRTINGSTVRYLEKWAQESECRGDQQLCKLADSHIVYSGTAATVISGLGPLEGRQVVVWADAKDVGTDDSVRPWTQRYTVSGGQITLATAASNVVVGLSYTASFKSAKLGLVGEASPLNQQKKVGHIGLILADTHRKGIQFGPNFNALDDMPSIEDGKPVTDEVITDYDQNLIPFPGIWTTDLRVCIQAQAPRPATVMAITPDLKAFS